MKKIVTLICLLITTSLVFGLGPGLKGGKHGSNYTVPEGINIEELNLKDGSYQGVAEGFRPDLKVEIKIISGELTNVEIVSHNEVGRQYYSVPMKYIPPLIVKKQQTEVDVVSGATSTSYAIMSAVENALLNAIID